MAERRSARSDDYMDTLILAVEDMGDTVYEIERKLERYEDSTDEAIMQLRRTVEAINRRKSEKEIAAEEGWCAAVLESGNKVKREINSASSKLHSSMESAVADYKHRTDLVASAAGKKNDEVIEKFSSDADQIVETALKSIEETREGMEAAAQAVRITAAACSVAMLVVCLVVGFTLYFAVRQWTAGMVEGFVFWAGSIVYWGILIALAIGVIALLTWVWRH